MQEKRKYERFALGLLGQIMSVDPDEGEVLDVLTSDVSAGGAFLHTPQPKDIGARVKLTLTVASERLIALTDAQGLLKVEGTVLRSCREGMAVYFNEEPELVHIALS